MSGRDLPLVFFFFGFFSPLIFCIVFLSLPLVLEAFIAIAVE